MSKPVHPSRRRRGAVALAALAAVLPAAPAAWAQAAQAPQVIEVVGTSPLPGLGVDRNLLPYGAFVVKRESLERAQADTLSDHLARRVPGMQSNEIQGNTFQSDVTFRGHRASGLLGAAQGLSVYLDGVRINEPFGDVVNWDMIPEFALQSLTLVSGANPAFGLNTLGGAIALATASGKTDPGTRADLSLGSFGRKRIDLSHGGSSDSGWHHYLAASAFDERGWRDHSPGTLGLLFGKIGHARAGSGWDLSLLAGRSRLVGNGLLPAQSFEDGVLEPDLYALRRNGIYTYPDPTRNALAHGAFNLSHRLDSGAQAQALAYVRRSTRRTLTGDVAEDAADEQHNAALNTNRTHQTAWGLASSLAMRSGTHQWQLGATLDASRMRYRQFEQAARFTADRGAVATSDETALMAEVGGRSLGLGIYATDTWRVTPATALTATLRLNRSRVSNQLSSVDDDSGVFRVHGQETFTYTSANPALGAVHQLAPELALFGNVARNTRVPTVIELGCADPEEPCRLPAGLQSDPFLQQVRSTSIETGLRWRPAAGHRLELSLYRTDNRDDILFTSVSATAQLGYFHNFPRTRHQGLDLDWQGRYGSTDLSLAYSLMQATYQAEGTLRSGDRNIVVVPGLRIAGLPRHTVKAGIDWRPWRGVGVGADLQWTSRRASAGNEDGRVADDAPDTLDLSRPGYSIVNLRLNWQASPTLEWFAKVNNLFDRRYETFGALAETVFDAAGAYTGHGRDAVFVAPGAPRSVFVGLRLRFE